MSTTLRADAAPPLLWTRWGLRRDVPAWLAIDAECAAAQGREAVTESELLATLRRRECIAMTADTGDDARGLLVYELQRDSLKLLRIAWPHACPQAAAVLIAKFRYKIESHRRTHGWLACADGTAFLVPDESLTLSPLWITSTVRALCAAGHPYLPVLADALEDGGCDDAVLLRMLREPLAGEAVYAMLAGQLAA